MKPREILHSITLLAILVFHYSFAFASETNSSFSTNISSGTSSLATTETLNLATTSALNNFNESDTHGETSIQETVSTTNTSILPSAASDTASTISTATGIETDEAAPIESETVQSSSATEDITTEDVNTTETTTPPESSDATTEPTDLQGIETMESVTAPEITVTNSSSPSSTEGSTATEESPTTTTLIQDEATTISIEAVNQSTTTSVEVIATSTSTELTTSAMDIGINTTTTGLLSSEANNSQVETSVATTEASTGSSDTNETETEGNETDSEQPVTTTGQEPLRPKTNTSSLHFTSNTSALTSPSQSLIINRTETNTRSLPMSFSSTLLDRNVTETRSESLMASNSSRPNVTSTIVALMTPTIVATGTLVNNGSGSTVLSLSLSDDGVNSSISVSVSDTETHSEKDGRNASRSATFSVTVQNTMSMTLRPTYSVSPVATRTMTTTATSERSRTRSHDESKTVEQSQSDTQTLTRTHDESKTVEQSHSDTQTLTKSMSVTASRTFNPSRSRSHVPTKTLTATRSNLVKVTRTHLITRSRTLYVTESQTIQVPSKHQPVACPPFARVVGVITGPIPIEIVTTRATTTTTSTGETADGIEEESPTAASAAGFAEYVETVERQTLIPVSAVSLAEAKIEPRSWSINEGDLKSNFVRLLFAANTPWLVLTSIMSVADATEGNADNEGVADSIREPGNFPNTYNTASYTCTRLFDYADSQGRMTTTTPPPTTDSSDNVTTTEDEDKELFYFLECRIPRVESYGIVATQTVHIFMDPGAMITSFRCGGTPLWAGSLVIEPPDYLRLINVFRSFSGIVAGAITALLAAGGASPVELQILGALLHTHCAPTSDRVLGHILMLFVSPFYKEGDIWMSFGNTLVIIVVLALQSFAIALIVAKKLWFDRRVRPKLPQFLRHAKTHPVGQPSTSATSVSQTDAAEAGGSAVVVQVNSIGTVTSDGAPSAAEESKKATSGSANLTTTEINPASGSVARPETPAPAVTRKEILQEIHKAMVTVRCPHITFLFVNYFHFGILYGAMRVIGKDDTAVGICLMLPALLMSMGAMLLTNFVIWPKAHYVPYQWMVITSSFPKKKGLDHTEDGESAVPASAINSPGPGHLAGNKAAARPQHFDPNNTAAAVLSPVGSVERPRGPPRHHHSKVSSGAFPPGSINNSNSKGAVSQGSNNKLNANIIANAKGANTNISTAGRVIIAILPVGRWAPQRLVSRYGAVIGPFRLLFYGSVSQQAFGLAVAVLLGAFRSVLTCLTVFILTIIALSAYASIIFYVKPSRSRFLDPLTAFAYVLLAAFTIIDALAVEEYNSELRNGKITLAFLMFFLLIIRGILLVVMSVIEWRERNYIAKNNKPNAKAASVAAATEGSAQRAARKRTITNTSSSADGQGIKAANAANLVAASRRLQLMVAGASVGDYSELGLGKLNSTSTPILMSATNGAMGAFREGDDDTVIDHGSNSSVVEYSSASGGENARESSATSHPASHHRRRRRVTSKGHRKVSSVTPPTTPSAVPAGDLIPLSPNPKLDPQHRDTFASNTPNANLEQYYFPPLAPNDSDRDQSASRQPLGTPPRHGRTVSSAMQSEGGASGGLVLTPRGLHFGPHSGGSIGGDERPSLCYSGPAVGGGSHDGSGNALMSFGPSGPMGTGEMMSLGMVSGLVESSANYVPSGHAGATISRHAGSETNSVTTPRHRGDSGTQHIHNQFMSSGSQQVVGLEGLVTGPSTLLITTSKPGGGSPTARPPKLWTSNHSAAGPQNSHDGLNSFFQQPNGSPFLAPGGKSSNSAGDSFHLGGNNNSMNAPTGAPIGNTATINSSYNLTNPLFELSDQKPNGASVSAFGRTTHSSSGDTPIGGRPPGSQTLSSTSKLVYSYEQSATSKQRTHSSSSTGADQSASPVTALPGYGGNVEIGGYPASSLPPLRPATAGSHPLFHMNQPSAASSSAVATSTAASPTTTQNPSLRSRLFAKKAEDTRNRQMQLQLQQQQQQQQQQDRGEEEV